MPGCLSKVSDINASFAWPRAYCTSATLEPTLSRMLATMRGLVVCTMFTGICAPSCALTGLNANIPELIGCSETYSGNIDYEYKSALEWAPESKIEIHMLPHPPSCLYSDIWSFVSDAAAREVDALQVPTFDNMKLILFKPGAVRTCAPCELHGGALCEHTRQCTLIAGTPCIDFSSFGFVCVAHRLVGQFCVCFVSGRRCTSARLYLLVFVTCGVITVITPPMETTPRGRTYMSPSARIRSSSQGAWCPSFGA